jgi:hypothetical protein
MMCLIHFRLVAPSSDDGKGLKTFISTALLSHALHYRILLASWLLSAPSLSWKWFSLV